MSKSSKLTRSSSKLPSPRKEAPGRARVPGIGEKLMRAGSDGTPNRNKPSTGAVQQDKAHIESRADDQPASSKKGEKCKINPSKASNQQQVYNQKQTKSNLKVTSLEDAEHISRRQVSPNGAPASKGDPKGGRTVPRRHTLGGARSSREILAMQPPEMDKKREAFLEHLKNKYPHHASAIMGHQERLREQSRSPKHGPSPQPSVGDQGDHLSLTSLESLDTMSEAEAPLGFTRGSRIRASLPVVRSTNQTKDRSLGVLYLQYGDETKQIRMPNEITSIDTIRALFVSAFPQQLTMKMLESPSVAVYVKDDMRNMYYELADVRNIADHSCLKVYHKDPAQAFSHGPRPANGDPRMHSEMAHPGRDGQHPLRHPPMGPPPHHPMQGAPPLSSHSMPPSPSRIPFGPRQASLPGTSTGPRERIANVNPNARSISPCPSAILERRDVKPDEGMGSKSHSLNRGNEGLYADPYMLQEGRVGMPGPHASHPCPGLDGPEHSMGGFHRASIRSTGSYSVPSPSDTIDHPSLFRQKSRNSQLPTLGSKTPPPSPHRMSEVRMIDIHSGPPHGMPPHSVPMERSSPVRQSFRKEDIVGSKPRNNVGPPVASEPHGPLHGLSPAPNDEQTRERMKAMEQQIASLTGLVQHALLKGPNSNGTKETQSERPQKTSSPASSAPSSGGSPVLVPKSNMAPSEKSTAPPGINLLQFKRNISDLKMQLHQMRQLQLQNQETLRVQMKRAEQEISVKLSEAMRRMEDPVHRQRALVEEDRHKYLGLEEHVLTQLNELEQYVGSLQKDSTTPQKGVTLKDVEEGAITLRKVGESLAGLKGEFPGLQTRMRSVLRVEVEAVKFLKEEPHKLDSMLKRVKNLTDTLSNLRRCATESSQRARDLSSGVLAANNPATSPEALVEASVQSAAAPEPQSSTIRSEVMPSSPVVIHHVQSSPVHIQQSQQSATLSASPPPTPAHTAVSSPNLSKTQGQESPKGATSNPQSPARHKRTHGNLGSSGNGTAQQDLIIEELQNSQEKSKNRTMSIEAAEREWAEKRQNMGHYDGKEFEKILQEAQANMLRGMPSVEVDENQPLHPAFVEPRDVQSTTVSVKGESGPGMHSDNAPKKRPDKLPKPLLDKPAKPSLEKLPKTATKPVTADGLTRQGSDKSNKSPPPPPPRKTYPSSSSGMTTTRSGEVVFTTRRESVSAQEGEEEAVAPSSPQPVHAKVPAEGKPYSTTPPPVTSSVSQEEEDEGDKIMAELQVFQKCTVKDVGVKNLVDPTPRIEPQIKELRPGALLPLKEKKSSEPSREDKDPDTDENGNTTMRQSPAVIYYVTGQITKDQLSPSGLEDTPENRESTQPPTQVSHVTVNDNSSSRQQQPPPLSPPAKSPSAVTPPPISPKPTGLNGFKLPRKPVKNAESLKKSAEMKKELLNKKNVEKKIKMNQEINSCKNLINKQQASTTRVPVNADPPRYVAPPLKNTSDEDDGEVKDYEGEPGLSPDVPAEEAPPPPDNIAFMITNTRVQPLSCGEYQQLVSAKKGSVETVTVGNATNNTLDPRGSQDNGFNKKPVIIIFDEPMDIRSAYKRLSTIFECEEELERMLAEERIDEESEESDTERSRDLSDRTGSTEADDGKKGSADKTSLSSSSSSSIPELAVNGMNGDFKQDGKKKFKFKFPKKQLAALTQAIRTGTKSGKKTLQVVVYEDEEESDGTLRQHKEAKRFEISRSKSFADPPKGLHKKTDSDVICRTDEIRKNTYKTLDSLEQTIKQLETTISEMGPCSTDESVSNEDAKARGGKSLEGGGLKRSSSLPASRGLVPKVSTKSFLQKKPKPQLLPRPAASSSATSATTPAPSVPSAVQQNTSVASPTSRMPVPMSAKARQSPGTSDKAAKQHKLQEAQRQFRQASGSAKRVGGDHKTASPTAPISKIPAFYPSSARGSSQPAQNSDATNPINPPPSSSSSMVKSSLLSTHTPRSSPLPSSHIPSLSNGSLKLPAPSQHTGKALSFSSQTQNGRVHSSSSSSSSSSFSSSSTSPSPLSPTPLGQGGKSIRTIHTPSFTSYRSHNGSSGKSCIPTATAAKDTI